MTYKEVMEELKKHGSDQTKKVLMNHGAKEPFFGVKVGDMKPIVKKIKKDYKLSLDLYDTGNSDAMYFAGLIADENLMTKKDLQKWAKNAYWYMLSEYTVPWITAESNHGFELALEWIDSDKEMIAAAGWATLSNLVSIKDDDELDLKLLKKLLKRVEKDLQNSKNRVRHTMNGFVIALGCYVEDLTIEALKTADKVGKVNVDMGGTACKVPAAREYIQKVKDKNRIGKKRKMARC
ncbi:MAG: DNA alkylation repair protein [Ignavibacteriae bacterium]|nr:DNA alkylation repair protein [Ignavibacteriota bacterium]NOG98305.1 DNA alkylation repair protein [Ignavibacteriota bacterium]